MRKSSCYSSAVLPVKGTARYNTAVLLFAVVCQAIEAEDRSDHEEEEPVPLEDGEDTLPPAERGAVELFVGSAEVRHFNNVYNGCMASTGNSPFSWCSLIAADTNLITAGTEPRKLVRHKVNNSSDKTAEVPLLCSGCVKQVFISSSPLCLCTDLRPVLLCLTVTKISKFLPANRVSLESCFR